MWIYEPEANTHFTAWIMQGMVENPELMLLLTHFLENMYIRGGKLFV